jgi:UDP-2-acetamido-2,6-beta-L-arabino-hexul-4-ose reductase
MLRIGITGQAGFIGTHLHNNLNLHEEKCNCIHFHDEYFQAGEALDAF